MFARLGLLRLLGTVQTLKQVEQVVRNPLVLNGAVKRAQPRPDIGMRPEPVLIPPRLRLHTLLKRTIVFCHTCNDRSVR